MTAIPSTSSSDQSQAQDYLGDLEKYGIATSNNLRELLTTCPDPVEGIKQFQQANSIQLPSLNPVMKLLDLHGIRRTEYHEAVVGELSERLLAKLRVLGEKQTPENVHKLEQHLERCFRLYRVPRIRPIVLETLAQLPKVADRYLKLIICDKEFYDLCAVNVRQQIWVKNDSLFLEAVEPVLDAYIREKEQLLIAGTGDKEKQVHFFTCDNPKSRRQKPRVQELISIVGQREVLYGRLIDLIRERFLATENPHYCSLRFELLMAAHDQNVEFLVRIDPCHEFAWCMDACAKHLRTKHLDAQQMSKLKGFLDSGKKGQNKPIEEMAMIAGDPHMLHLIASFAVKILRDNASNGFHLPREMHSLQLLVKLLLMGLHVKELLQGALTLQQLIDPEIFTVFLAAFSSMLVHDVIRIEVLNAPDEFGDMFSAELETKPRPPSLDRFLGQSRLCALLWLHHLALGDNSPLSSSKRRPFDQENALRYADTLPWLAGHIAISNPWVLLLKHKLLQSSAVFSSELTAKLILKNLFILNSQTAHNKFHLLHLCVQHRSIIPVATLKFAYEWLLKQISAHNADCGPSTAAMEGDDIQMAFDIEFEKCREKLLTALQQKETIFPAVGGEEEEQGDMDEQVKKSSQIEVAKGTKPIDEIAMANEREEGEIEEDIDQHTGSR